ncbi:unnamed protein product [Urochloa humidicola]
MVVIKISKCEGMKKNIVFTTTVELAYGVLMEITSNRARRNEKRARILFFHGCRACKPKVCRNPSLAMSMMELSTAERTEKMCWWFQLLLAHLEQEKRMKLAIVNGLLGGDFQ